MLLPSHSLVHIARLALVLAAGNSLFGERVLEPEGRAAESYVLGLRSRLALDDRHRFDTTSLFRDQLGEHHARIEQRYNGVRVLFGDGILHDRSGRDFSDPSHCDLTEAFLRDISLPSVPSLQATEAVAIASAERNAKGCFGYEPEPELVVWPITEDVRREGREDVPTDQLNAMDMERRVKEYRLVYLVELFTANDSDGFSQWLYFIDAHTGAILNKVDTLLSEAAQGTGHSMYCGTVPLDTNSVKDGFELRDTTRGTGQGGSGSMGTGNVTTNLNGEKSGRGTIYTDPDNTWGDGKNYTGESTTSDNGQTAAVDAHYGVQVVWDYLKYVHGRDGLNGKGRPVTAQVHLEKNLFNAFWVEHFYWANFGDGKPAGKCLVCLDTVGHELGHGVCGSTAKLGNMSDIGGIGESNSDIHGQMVQFYGKGGGFAAHSAEVPETGGQFIVGEDLSKIIRWMYKPSKDGKSPDAWKSDIGNMATHHAAGPNNRAFYFLCRGATVDGETSAPQYLPNGMQGVGNTKAAKIWYRALSTYMTSGSGYNATRDACIKAAKDLYGPGSESEAAVHNAYAGVNVGKPWSGETVPDKRR